MTTTLPAGSDMSNAPLLVVRTRIIEATADELAGTIVGAFANEPLRDETSHPELVLEALPAQDMAESESLAKSLREAHAEAITDGAEHIKIVRLADATTAELDAANLARTIDGEVDDLIRRTLAAADQAVPAKDLAMLLAQHAPGLPYVGLGRLAAALDKAGYQVTRKTTGQAGAPC